MKARKKKKSVNHVYQKRIFWKRVDIISVIVSIAVLAFAISLCNHSINFRIKYESPKDGATQIYWDYGTGFSEVASRAVDSKRGVAKIRFSQKDIKQLRQLRLDIPCNEKGVCNFAGVSMTLFGFDIYEYSGSSIQKRNYTTNDIENIMPVQENNWKMRAVGTDPYIVLSGIFIIRIKENAQKIFYVSNFIRAAILYFIIRIVIFLFLEYRSVLLAFIRGLAFEKMRLRYVISYVIIGIIFTASYIIFWLYRFFIKQFNGVSFSEMLFHLKMPMEGTGETAIMEVLNFIKIPIIVEGVILVILFIIMLYAKKIRNNKMTLYVCSGATVLFLIVTVVLSYRDFGVGKYIELYMQKSTFIEEEYKDPSQVDLKFPEKKRNLIYIYMESMESTFISSKEGGTMDKNLLPELTKLAQENINFSEDELVGGARSTVGTGWTVAAMAAQSAGLPLLLPIDGNSYDHFGAFLPGCVSLGDLLEKEGYKQEIMVGSKLEFGGRNLYFQQHGNYKIWDYITAIQKGKIEKDYYEWWGYEDQKLYSYAKEEILSLAKQNQPFNFTMLTVDTHRPDGYLCDICPDTFDNQYENVLSCASQQVSDFVSWIQKQDFYKDTTVIICGDHPTMDNDFITTHYNRRKPRCVYNCIINSAIDATKDKNRKFTTIDMYPTTLAAMGVVVEGERLGLGTNLFSGEETLAERYGYDKLDEEFSKMSTFYNKNILRE